MTTGPGPADPPTDVAAPDHPLHAMTTYELRDYRRDLEAAIALSDRSGSVSQERSGSVSQERAGSVSQARASLQARLDDLLAEQADRQKLADA